MHINGYFNRNEHTLPGEQKETHTVAHMSVGTSEPLGVMLDSAQSRTVPEATVDHRINGQEVCNRGCKQIPL